MDFAKEPQRVLSFCAGYGGIELGLQRAGVDVRTCAYVEIEAFAAYNLVKKIEAGYLPVGPVYTDLKTFPSRQFRGCVDGLVGGYPCQPFSQAGQRKGEQDPRHLWPWIASAIRIIRPRWCIFENVEGHITKGLRNVLSDLGELGFRTTWGIFSAAEVGLPHQRKRVFILAHTYCNGMRGSGNKLERISKIGQRRQNLETHCKLPRKGMAHSHNSRGRKDQQLPQLRSTRVKQSSKSPRQDSAAKKTHEVAQAPAGPEQQQHWWEPPRVISGPELGNSNGTRQQKRQGEQVQKVQGTDTASREKPIGEAESQMGGDADGSTCGMDYAELCGTVDNRTDELRLLGNGVVPATFEEAWRELWTRMI